MSAKLGEILVRENLISPQHLRQALDYQREHGGRLGFNLVKLGLVSDDTITAVLSRQYGIPSVNLDLFDIEDSVLRLIPQEVAHKYSVLPLSRLRSSLTRMSEDAPVVRLVNVLLVDAMRRGASDIHVEPYEKELRIRFRIDGLLYDVMHPPLKMRDALISRIKIMSKLDISEKRLPQDGRIKIRVKVDSRSRELDFRVSTLPTLFGEKVVLRLLDKEKLMLDMTNLGFEPESLVKFQRNIARPYGMVLVTGPTRIGHTNTLYSALQSLNTADTNIMTAEYPVELNLPSVNQVQMKEQI